MQQKSLLSARAAVFVARAECVHHAKVDDDDDAMFGYSSPFTAAPAFTPWRSAPATPSPSPSFMATSRSRGLALPPTSSAVAAAAAARTTVTVRSGGTAVFQCARSLALLTAANGAAAPQSPGECSADGDPSSCGPDSRTEDVGSSATGSPPAETSSAAQLPAGAVAVAEQQQEHQPGDAPSPSPHADGAAEEVPIFFCNVHVVLGALQLCAGADPGALERACIAAGSLVGCFSSCAGLRHAGIFSVSLDYDEGAATAVACKAGGSVAGETVETPAVAPLALHPGGGNDGGIAGGCTCVIKTKVAKVSKARRCARK